MTRGNRGSGSSCNRRRMIALKLTMAVLLALLLVPLAAAGVQAAPGDVTLVSANAGGLQGDASSTLPRMTPDGRYVVFQSIATNLVPGAGGLQVYRKDLQTGQVKLCSANAAGTQGDNASYYPVISSDGRYVAFYSQATNLVSPATSGSQVFRKDLQTGQVSLVSASAAGAEGDNQSSNPRISADGRYVAFHSQATNLVTPATVNIQVFRKDMETGEIELASANAGGTPGDGGAAYIPDITPDGRYVCFTSTSTNLVTPATTSQELFLKDMDTKEIKLVSSDAAGAESNQSNGYPSCTPDGGYVSFASNSNNLIPGAAGQQVYRKDLATGEIVYASADASGNQGTGGFSMYSYISVDGRYVALESAATNLIPGVSGGDVYRKDLSTAAIILVSADAGGAQGNGASTFPSMDPDGRYVAFHSTASNLVTPATANNQVFRKELALPVPVITSIDPVKGPVGTEVTIQGQDFRGPDMGGYVTFGATQATDYTSWTDTEIKCLVPPGGTGPMDVWVTTSGGASNHVDFNVTAFLFYFAEGYTGAGFQEYLCLGNARTAPVEVTVTFMFRGGGTQVETYTVPAQSRYTVDVNGTVPAGSEVSARVSCEWPIVAERPMYFDYTGAGEHWTGGHDAVGAAAPAQAWYFAEGYTGPGFNEYVCVLNPGNNDADLTFRFQTQGDEIVVGGKSVPAHSRETFLANELIGGAYEASLKLESTQPVVAERPMYFDYTGYGAPGWTGGHCVMGTTVLADEYFFAEGYTGTGFDEYITLQNPGAAAITVDAVYQLGPGQGGPVSQSYSVPAAGRRTVYVNGTEGVGTGVDASVRLTCASDFLAERPMYFDYTGYGAPGWTGGHCVIGATSTGGTWFFAEGYTGSGFDEFLCIQNPGTAGASVTITYFPEGGTPIAKAPITVAANSRSTVYVNGPEGAGPDLAISAEVVSTQPVIVERPMYFNYGGVWTGGHDVLGFVP